MLAFRGTPPPAFLMPNKNLQLWNSVKDADPRYLKTVNTRGGFTAIDAYYQIRLATETWGPVGIGWGWETAWAEGPNCVIARVTLWHSGDRTATVPGVGCASWGKPDRPDTDAPKKAQTDGLTKAFSFVGLSASVFLDEAKKGNFEGNKYTAESTAPRTPPSQATRPQAPANLNYQPPADTDLDLSWLDDPVAFGKFSKRDNQHAQQYGAPLTWRQLTEGSLDGQRHQWLLFMAAQDPRTDRNGEPIKRQEWIDTNLVTQRHVVKCAELLEARAANGTATDEALSVEDVPF